MKDMSIDTYKRLAFYHSILKNILICDKSFCDISKFENKIHDLLQHNYVPSNNKSNINFKFGDKVVLSDYSLVSFFPKNLCTIPILGIVISTESSFVGNNLVYVEDSITGNKLFMGVNSIEKVDLNKEYVLKILTLIDVSRRAFKGEKFDFLNDDDISILKDNYKKTRSLCPEEIKKLEIIANTFLPIEKNKERTSSEKDYKLKKVFYNKLRSYFSLDVIDEKVKQALKTYYQLYEETTDEVDNIEKQLFIHYIVESFKYDFFTKNKTLNSLERLTFTRTMAICYTKLASKSYLRFESLKPYVLESLGSFENTIINNKIIDNSILMAIYNFKKDEKRYYK